MNKIKISSEALISLSSEDGSTVNESWFNKLDESLRTVYLSGHLDDEDNNINNFYKQIKEKAGGNVTSINYTSRKLGYDISISQKKGSIHSKSRFATAESLINYFRDKIVKEL